MVDAVSGSAISTLLRAQTTGVSAGIAALKSNQQAQQAIINQLQQSATQSKAIAAQSPKNAPAPATSSSLPRGSLVDFYA